MLRSLRKNVLSRLLLAFAIMALHSCALTAPVLRVPATPGLVSRWGIGSLPLALSHSCGPHLVMDQRLVQGPPLLWFRATYVALRVEAGYFVGCFGNPRSSAADVQSRPGTYDLVLLLVLAQSVVDTRAVTKVTGSAVRSTRSA